MPSRVAQHTAQHQQPARAADAQRLAHDVVGSSRWITREAKTTAALPSGSGQGWSQSATISDGEPSAALARNTLQHRGRGIEADVANRQAREVRPDLARAGAKLQHEIIGLQRRHSSTIARATAAPAVAGSPARAS